MYSQLTIIIPTLNEHRNISRLLASILRAYAGVSVIVADDGSTDGTQEDVARIASRHSGVRLLDRRSCRHHGLTASVMDAALLCSTRYTVVMDGDMQHPYEKVAEIFAALQRHPIAIGVRTQVRDWGLHRRIISKTMGMISSVAFRARGRPTSSDMMSGFFGIRTALLKRAIRKHGGGFVPEGYKVLLDVLRTSDGIYSICEVPYSTFSPRMYGRSKFGMKHVGETLRSTFR